MLLCLTACSATLLLLKADLSSVVDNFHAQRSERMILDAWRRQAVEATPAECLERPGICTGKVVVWTIARGIPTPIHWLNPDQVPPLRRRGSQFEAVAIVKRVLPDSIEAVFLGSPQAAYGGTTFKSGFGLAHGAQEIGISTKTLEAIRSAVGPADE
ncbi:MAG: hypothetical protein HZB91_04320 [Elusimicrobia bacterium]|nr:hypothetical protein [Elusimicrobiota bacterium]